MTESKVTFKINTTNGFEEKTPFLIGVAGGTASGKVKKIPNKATLQYIYCKHSICRVLFVSELWKSWAKWIWIRHKDR